MLAAVLVMSALLVGASWCLVAGLQDRTGVMQDRDLHGFEHGRLSRLLGGLNKTATHGNSTTETEIYRSELISPDALRNGFNFNLQGFGTIGSDGSDDVTLSVKAIEPDGTAVELFTVTTVSIPDEDDKAFFLVLNGRVVLEQAGAVSGKIAGGGIMTCRFATPLIFSGLSAAAGVAVDFRNGIHLVITADWDDAAATSTMSLISAVLNACNTRGGSGL